MGRGGDRRTTAALAAAGVERVFEDSPLPPGVQRLPSSPPPFTLATLRAAVPPHCFVRSTLRSFSFLAFDCLLAAAIFLALWKARSVAPPAALLPLWLAYAVVQGTVCTGIWVLAHECGHGAFSSSRLVCDSVGFVFHSLLLAPYFSWKFSHSRHHAGTGSLTRDEVFLPDTVAEARAKPAWLLESVVGRGALLAIALAFGWPAYLARNASSNRYKDSTTRVNHFSPWSPVFRSRRESAFVLLSDVGVCAVAAGLYRCAAATSVPLVVGAYVAPLFVTNLWLVLITLQQHTHAALPHFDDADWTWLHGACSTVDRDNGVLLNALHHHIADTRASPAAWRARDG
jgi:omega-6 fatty acid desaturase (delta-12 desaturase)